MIAPDGCRTPSRHGRRPTAGRRRLAFLLAFAGMLNGCNRAPPEPAHEKIPVAVDAARCAQNRAAGPINFLTSFGYMPSSGILDVITAQRLGYFDALCLDVRIRPGSTNEQLVSAGTAQIAGLGDAASTILAIDRGANLTGIATYANTSAIELIALRDGRVRSLSDLAGKMVGYKVALAPQVIAMLIRAGVAPDSVKFVSVPFNPAFLANGQVAAISGYKSNEPRALEALGHPVLEWDPQDYGVRSTFSVIVANRLWAGSHPSAVEDFLRATLRAYGWIGRSDANLDRALRFALDLSTTGFDPAKGRERWRFEARLISASQPPGTALGYNVPAQWQAEAETLAQARLVRRTMPPAAYDNRFINAIYQGKTLIWPAP